MSLFMIIIIYYYLLIIYPALAQLLYSPGWLELDLIIGSFVKNRREYLLDHQKLDELEDITDEENSDLIRWLVEGWEIPEKFASNKMMKELIEYSYSPNKPWYPTAGNQ